MKYSTAVTKHKVNMHGKISCEISKTIKVQNTYSMIEVGEKLHM